MFILWIVAIILIIVGKNKPSNIWAAITLFVGGTSGITFVLNDVIIPKLIQQQVNLNTIDALVIVSRFFDYFSSRFSFPFIMFCLYFNTSTAKIIYKNIIYRYFVPVILFIPLIAATYGSTYETGYHFSNSLIHIIYTFTYVLAGCYLIYLEYRSEIDPVIKRRNLIVFLMVAPVVIGSAILGPLICGFLALGDTWKYEIWLFVYLIVLYFFLVFKFGFMGLKANITFIRTDSTLESVRYGAAMYNHAIKNEIYKIANFAIALKNNLGIEQANKVDIIEKSSERLIHLSERMKSQLYNIKFKDNLVSLEEVIDTAIDSVQLKKDITINKKYSSNKKTMLLCDDTLLCEAIINIYKNAIDAVEEKGIIDFEIKNMNKWICISITDNGIGMDNFETLKVFEPFYTTKEGSNNFGIGLTFSNEVIRKHGGSLKIKSRKNEGTEVIIKIPIKRVINNDNK